MSVYLLIAVVHRLAHPHVAAATAILLPAFAIFVHRCSCVKLDLPAGSPVLAQLREQPVLPLYFLIQPSLATPMPGASASSKIVGQGSAAPKASASGAAASVKPVGQGSPAPKASPSWATIPKPMAGSSRRVRLDDLSPGTGWRDEQPSVVSQFVADFPETYGQSITAGIKVLSPDDSFKTYSRDSNNKILVDDGRSTVAALLQLKARVDAQDSALDSFCLHLQEVMNLGVPVTPLYYEDNSVTFRKLWNIGCHSEDNNKYLAATVADHVKAVKSVAEMYPGEAKWDDTTKYMMSVYGKSRRRNICRWVSLAKRLPGEVITWIDTRVATKGLAHKMKDTYFYDNPYLGGSVSQAHQQLSAENSVKALNWLAVALDTGSAATRGRSAPFCLV